MSNDQTITPNPLALNSNQSRIVAFITSIAISIYITVISFFSWVTTEYWNILSIKLIPFGYQVAKILYSIKPFDLQDGGTASMLIILLLIIILLTIPLYHIIFLCKVIGNSPKTLKWGKGACIYGLAGNISFFAVIWFINTHLRIPVIPTYVPISIFCLSLLNRCFILPKAFIDQKKPK
jgi:hypothetical protein